MSGNLQPTFAGGEIGPGLYGRVDQSRYYTSLRLCKNFIVRPQGGVSNRPGTRLIAEVKDSEKPVRLLPFVFSSEQTYILEFGEYYIRLFQQGLAVIDTSAAAQSANAVQMRPLRKLGESGLSVAAFADNPIASNIQSGDFNAPPALETQYHTDVPLEVKTPYRANELMDLMVTQSADVMTIVHPNHPPQQLKRYSGNDWRLEAFDYREGPFEDINTDQRLKIELTRSDSDHTVTLTGILDESDDTSAQSQTLSKPISALSFTDDDIGRLVYVELQDYSFYLPWRAQVEINLGDIRYSDRKIYRCSRVIRDTRNETDTGSDTESGNETQTPQSSESGDEIEIPTDPIVNPSDDPSITPSLVKYYTGTLQPVHEEGKAWDGDGLDLPDDDMGPIGVEWEYLSSGYAILRIRELVKQNETDTQSHTVIAEIIKMPPDGLIGAENASYKWAKGAWSKASGFPSCVAYHQQRMVFANTKTQPQTIWFSKTGDFNHFGHSTPVVDDDAITVTLGCQRVDAVRHLVSMNVLLALTTGSEWAIKGSDDVLTPQSIVLKRQSYRGSARAPALVVGETVVFLQEKGNQIRDIGYRFEDDAYTGNDLSVFAPHLFERHQITDWAYAQIPFSIIWSIRSDGILLGLTYMREHQTVAWHWHETNGQFESVCCVGEQDEDAVYVVVRREINGKKKRYIERFESRINKDPHEWLFMDCALAPYDGRNMPGKIKIVNGNRWNDREILTVQWDAQKQTDTSNTSEHSESSETVDADISPVYFSESDIGSSLVLYGEDTKTVIRLEIVNIVNSNQVEVRSNRNIPMTLRETWISNWAWGRRTFSGLDDFEGQTMMIVADGEVIVKPVVNGQLGPLDVPAVFVQTGLGFSADMETLDVTSSRQSFLEKQKLIRKVTILAESSRGLWAGPDFKRMSEAKQREDECYDDHIRQRTGFFDVHIDARWSRNGRVCIRQKDPLPLTVLGVIPDILAG